MAALKTAMSLRVEITRLEWEVFNLKDKATKSEGKAAKLEDKLEEIKNEVGD